MTNTNPSAVVAVVGLGLHGSEIALLAHRQGHRVAGAVDIGAKVGQPIRVLLGEPGLPDVTVDGSVEELLERVPDLDAVLLTAAGGPEVVVAQAAAALAAGVNVLTLHQDLFEPEGAWVERLDRIGRRTGATFLSTGVQDAWWVHLPIVAAGSVTDLRAITYTHTLDASTLSEAVAAEEGVGIAPGDFPALVEEVLRHPPILGAPVREAVRLLGLTPGSEERTVEGIFANGPEAPSTGAVDTSRSTTAEGVVVTAVFRTALLGEGEQHSDELLIEATPTLSLVHRPFPGEEITNAVIVNRIPDVVAAPGGVTRAAALPAARYRSRPGA